MNRRLFVGTGFALVMVAVIMFRWGQNEAKADTNSPWACSSKVSVPETALTSIAVCQGHGFKCAVLFNFGKSGIEGTSLSCIQSGGILK